ncbi:MAG TPA: PQQ-dependent sugar dehydrogenase [Flavisolibacter sp.]|nr:PQQ-dependent sugar dehydrogenase [Flavisolibacter sp.]
MTKLLRGRLLLPFVFSLFSSLSFAQNNSCGSAPLLSGCSTTGTVVGATADGSVVAPCTGTVRYDVWYRFTATSTNPTITLSNIGTNFSNHKPKLQVLSGSACTSLTSIACGGTTLTASGLTTGTTYYIRIYALTADATSTPTTTAGFTICISDPAPFLSSRMNEVFQQTTLSGTNMIDDPWEVTYGPDNFLWITEAKGYRVFRMNPSTGARTTILDLTNAATGYLTNAEHTAFNRTFNISTNNPQGGLAGLAIHPDWTNKKFVYISYVHTYNSTAANSAGVFFTNRIVRFTYNTSTNKLESPVSLCDTLPGSGDHNSQRMIIAPVGGTNYLFYAAGDMGAGQFGNATRPVKAQFTGAYEGKILRFNLEPDADAGTLDRWIPNDNPYNTSSPAKQNAVWCTGIRNNQGFAFANGKLYGSSHGPYSDDEINILERDKNYGHPLVIGYADGNYNNSKAGHNNGSDVTIMPLITNEVAAAAAISNYKDPLFSAYAAPQATIYGIWTNPNGNGGNGNWPSEGWSGMDIYNHTVIPGWKNSLILSSLKWGRILRFKLDATGSDILPIAGFDTLSYFGSRNRFRDVAISPDGKDIFIVMDKSETPSGPSAANPKVSACNGCVQRYTFLGYNDVSGKSSIPTSIPVAEGTANSCNTATTVTIDASNNTIWVPITGPDGNIMAEINANGNNLGTITSSYYTHSGAVRISGPRRYLHRNITIIPQNQPSTPVGIRLYMTKAEYDALDADPGSGVSSIANLRILKNNDACSSSPQNPTTVITPTYAEPHGTDGYVLQANINSFSSFYFASANFTLPLDLITFEGSLKNNLTHLQWTTENEANASHFVVERSTDGINYTAIGQVNARNNGTRSNYSFDDKDVTTLQATTVHYRLMIVDNNNLFKYSNVVTVTFTNRNSIVTLMPNPVQHTTQVRIYAERSGAAQWKLVDNNGRLVQQSIVQLQKGQQIVFDLNMEKHAQGTYFLQILGAGIDQKIKLQKL